ncbi:recombination-associated protein RdgC [Roseateles sp. SL47]|uniref:recombination-associated protein RdgC n=1 Tax=Roseateles sp. SL47 TaxID=2995138 RepID=UPI002270504C|nr:recombination-associated protein RdgC [Roseateles sp. SL47]WAC72086.1 recombination-associated protein RdgC [Roseateles sp. SL47]
MFKHLILYRIDEAWQPQLLQFAEVLEGQRFERTGPTQRVSAGWVPPRGDGLEAIIELIDGQWLLTLRIERRAVPASALREAVKEAAGKVEQMTGRKPGKKQLKDIKEQTELELLPRAFPTQSDMRVWIDPVARLLTVESGSVGKADELISLLIKADPSLGLRLLNSAHAPAACMTAWLIDGQPPAGFTIDRELEARAPDEMKSRVRYDRHNLDTEEVKAHLAGGKLPTRLAMTWRDRISFTLTDGLQLKGLKFLDIVFDGRDKPAKDEAFDVDAALFTGELRQLIPDLIEGLGGELDLIGHSARIAAEHAPVSPEAV